MVIVKKSYDELTPAEQQVLMGKYGIQPKSGGGFSRYMIDYVREITGDEKIFFQEKSFLSPHFVTQSLYKLRGNLQPIMFNRILKNQISKLEGLRTNYVQLNDKIVAVVFENRVDLPPVNFKSMITMDEDDIDSSLRTIMEADMREPFDLVRGHLIRFSIYKTKEDEYAVLATMAHLIFPYVDLTKIFREALGYSDEKSSGNISGVSDLGKRVNDPLVKSYWEKMLESLPKLPQIPYAKNDTVGHKQSKVYRKKLDDVLTGDLLKIAKSNRLLLMAIIESAWSLFLAEFNSMNDVFFSALLPDKKANLSAPSVRAMPVRIKIHGDMTVEQFVMQNFQQIIISKPYSSLQIDELHEISGKSERLFNHFLSFYNFLDEEKEYSDVSATESGALVMRNSWDSGPSHLGFYFQYENRNITLTLIYDAGSFANNDEVKLINRFFLIIQQMITDYNADLMRFWSNLNNRVAASRDDNANQSLNMRYEITGIPIFQNLSGENLELVLDNTVYKKFFEGDRISGEDVRENLVFLLKGKVSRNIDTGDGWYRAMDIAKEGSLLNITSFLDKPRLPMSIEVLTDEAEIIFIKKPPLETVVKKHHYIGRNFLTYALNEMEKYQFLWIQS